MLLQVLLFIMPDHETVMVLITVSKNLDVLVTQVQKHDNRRKVENTDLSLFSMHFCFYLVEILPGKVGRNR